MAGVIAGGLGLALFSQGAIAGPGPVVTAPMAAPALIQEIGYWKRQWRRRGYGPDVVVVPNGDGEAESTGDVDVEVEAPSVVVLPPPRPLSCGQYRYWNGTACVDARYNDPYIGPK
jgi:hypothetical protein